MIGEIKSQCLNGCGELTCTLYEGFEIAVSRYKCAQQGAFGWIKFKFIENSVIKKIKIER